MRGLRFTLILTCLFLAVWGTQATAQDYTQLSLPEGAKARLGKGRLSGHIAYSPNGDRLAVASSIGIWLYDTQTYQEVNLVTGHRGGVSIVAFSTDGRTLASGGRDQTIRLWDAVTGEPKHTLTGHTDWISSVSFSPDGRTLASGGFETVRLWDAVTGEPKHILTGRTNRVRSVSFSPDGRTLASGGFETIRLWDAVTGELKHTLTGHTDWWINSVSFSPDGRTLASGGQDQTIRLWDAITGELKRTLTGHTRGIYSVGFSPDGRTLASASTDIRLWDATTGAPKHTLTGHTGGVSSIVFSPDGQTLASGSADIRLWDVATGAHKRTLTRHTNWWINSVSFSPDGRTLASASGQWNGNPLDDIIWLWDAVTGERKHTLTGHTDWISSVSFSPDGQTLASGSWDRTIRLWDAITGAPKHTLTEHRGIYSVGFSPDGRTLASGGQVGIIRLSDAVTGELKRTLTGHTGGVRSISFSPDGRTLASGGEDQTVRLWDAVTGELKRTLTGHTGGVRSISFSPDGRTLTSGSGDATVRLWDAITGAHKSTLTRHTDWPVESVAFSFDGRTIASGSGDGTIRLWDAITGAHKSTLTGHTDRVHSISFSRNGRTFASGSRDGTVLLWEIAPIANANATVSVSPSPVPSPSIGEQLMLSLKITGGENVAGYQANVHFDPTALRYVESTNGDYLPAGAFFVPPVAEANRVTLGATALAGVSSGNGTLATLTFEVVNVKKSILTLFNVILTNSNGETLPPPLIEAGRIEPTGVPSSAIVSVTPSLVLSPAIGEQLVFNVDITGGQDVVGHQLTWEFDNTAFRHLSTSQGDYLAAGVGNGDGRFMTGTFEVLAVRASTVSVSGYLIGSNGLRIIPTFESADVVAPLLGDVNRDGMVNILDLAVVAASFNQQVSAGGNPADVNEDGVVNIVDLAKVAGALGNTGAAPSAHPETLTMFTTTDVQGWLTQAQGLDLTDAALQRGIIFLEQLLVALTPKETALLPNYPNPFNPETWIPYHLAHAADVTFTIYDTKGVVVRRLDLGHQPAGYYTARARAAYWEGRNNLGEQVGSGVYFYQLSVANSRSEAGAGDFSATRKMVILK